MTPVGLAVFGCVLLVLGWFAWRRPQVGLLVLAALTPLDGLSVLLPAGTVPAWWKEAIVALTLVISVVAPQRWPRRRLNLPWWPAIAALVVVGSISGFIAFGALAVLPIKITFFYISIVVILWRAPFSVLDRDRLVTIMLGVGVLNATYGVMQQVIGENGLVDLGYRYGQEVRSAGSVLRSFGTFNQPFPYALYLMMTILVVLAVTLADPRRQRSRVFFWCLPLLIAGMALSVVRASYVGLVAGLLLLGIIRYRSVLYALAGTAAVAIPVALVVIPPATLGTVFSPKSYQTRIEGWATIWQSITAHPFGQGLGASGSAAEKLTSGSIQLPEHLRTRIDGATAFAFGLPYQPDNYYVKLLIELGPIGLWLFILFLCSVVASSIYTTRRAVSEIDAALAAGIGAVVVAAGVASFVSTYLEIFPLDVYLWLLVGTLACIPCTSHDRDPTWRELGPSASNAAADSSTTSHAGLDGPRPERTRT